VSGLTVTDLHKAFGSQPVLTGVHLEVPEGSLTAVLGPSGSGKTTMLRVVAGFERADRGTVTLAGRLVEDSHHALPPEQRGIGYVPQDGSLFPHLTVAANVAFGVRRSSRRALGSNTDELLEMVGLTGMGHRYPHQLSGGQQQRVALARALAIRPALVLLDEPFSSLDAGLRASVRSDVQAVLRAGGVTAVLVTHDQDEALSVADQVAVIREGDGDRVATPFGPLSLRRDAHPRAYSGPAVALVRPEQLILSTAMSGAGIRARVVRTEFHGHDTVITVDPDALADRSPITVRAEGDLVVADGTEVEITAVGSAVAWPARVG
jgi:iron(III) transport system ATP-binding protein